MQAFPIGHVHLRVALLLSGGRARLHAAKPETIAEQGDTLGAHLTRRRNELALRRIDAAKLLGVHWKTLMWWERDRRQPLDSAYPAIIAFLGYEPWLEPRTLAEALAAERRRRGLNIKQTACTVGVDEGTWVRWERAEWKPTSLTLPQIGRFLGMDIKVGFPEGVRRISGPD